MSILFKKTVSVIILLVIISMLVVNFEPILFEVYANSVYDRKVDFKNISADISILSSVVEFEDSEVAAEYKELKNKLGKIRNENFSEEEKDKKAIEEITKKKSKPSKLSKLQEKLEKNPNDKEVLKKIGKLMRVKVDKVKMKDLKIAKKSVETYSQMLEFQNEMMNDPENMYKMVPDAKKYPELVEFFDEATKVAKSGEEYFVKASDSSVLVNPFNVSALIGNIISETQGRVDCGYFGNYKPWGQKYNIGWKVSSKQNARDTLISWGYHETVISAFRASKYDFTRPQTFMGWSCGYNTFRDHAAFEIIDYRWVSQYPNSYWNMPYRIVEQNYNGWSPRGEPNPEIYLSGPWPYLDWPVYVWHYHQTFTAPYTINYY